MEIEIVVNKLIRKYKTNDPFKLAELMNINIQYLDLPEKCEGYYLRTLRRRFIAINANSPYERQRVTCAHEIGHDRLHKGLGYYFIEQQTLFTPGKFERQANHFALRLLTGSENIEADETLTEFLLRCSIPRELHKFY